MRSALRSAFLGIACTAGARVTSWYIISDSAARVLNSYPGTSFTTARNARSIFSIVSRCQSTCGRNTAQGRLGSVSSGCRYFCQKILSGLPPTSRG